MGCCGQKRDELRERSAVPAPRMKNPRKPASQATSIPTTTASRAPSRPDSHAPAQPPTASAPGNTVRLAYLERSPIRVRGPSTGSEYRFSAAQQVQHVALADAEALLRTHYFRRV